MRRKLFLSGIVLFVLLCSSLFVSVDAASMWSQTYGGAGDDKAHSLVATSDGGFAIAGFTDSSGAGDRDFWLVKTDASGNVQWNRTYGGSGAEVAYSLVATSDGGYAIAGYTSSFGAGRPDFWLVKTDSNGNMVWNRTYGGTGEEIAESLVATSDGGYAMAGSTNSFGTDHDFLLVKTDALGNVQWNKTYSGKASDYAHALAVTPDEGYAIAGMTWGSSHYGFWLVKTDASGNIQWNEVYGGELKGGYEAYSVITTPDEGYALAGYNSGEFMLVKTDSVGKMKWSKVYKGYDNAWAYSLVATSDGGYALAGNTAYIRGSKVYIFLVKTDVNGVMEWNQTYGAGDARSLVATSDGGYAIAASTQYFFNAGGGGDFLFIKTDEAGAIPEYPLWVIPLVMATVTAIIIVNKKKLLRPR